MDPAPARLPSQQVLDELIGHGIAGVATFVTLVAWVLARDEGLRNLCWREPALATMLGFGALITFAPVIFCVAVASLQRGIQTMPVFTDSD